MNTISTFNEYVFETLQRLQNDNIVTTHELILE